MQPVVGARGRGGEGRGGGGGGGCTGVILVNHEIYNLGVVNVCNVPVGQAGNCVALTTPFV